MVLSGPSHVGGYQEKEGKWERSRAIVDGKILVLFFVFGECSTGGPSWGSTYVRLALGHRLAPPSL